MDTIYLANVHGPVAFHDSKGGIAGILDWRAVQKMVDNAQKKVKKAPARAKAAPVKRVTAKAA
jgi:hypothetical protein